MLAVTGTELRRLELGRLGDGRPFVNVASAGLASVAGAGRRRSSRGSGRSPTRVGARRAAPRPRRCGAPCAPTARPCSTARRGR